MENDPLAIQRKSHMELGEIYFWTATIHKWIPLLKDDSLKERIIESLEHLSREGKIEVFAFVIMPNHMHAIWRMKSLNGKEMPHASLLKYTAHHFKQYATNTGNLASFYVDAANKEFEFWQRDSLAVRLYTRNVAFQKLHYIHQNPLHERWNLCTRPEDYRFSSARFYEKGRCDFSFLQDIRAEF
jgi:REP element-mobilizing transposase RayT